MNCLYKYPEHLRGSLELLYIFCHLVRTSPFAQQQKAATVSAPYATNITLPAFVPWLLEPPSPRLFPGIRTTCLSTAPVYRATFIPAPSTVAVDSWDRMNQVFVSILYEKSCFRCIWKNFIPTERNNTKYNFRSCYTSSIGDRFDMVDDAVSRSSDECSLLSRLVPTMSEFWEYLWHKPFPLPAVANTFR